MTTLMPTANIKFDTQQLGKFQRCPTCRQLDFTNRHICPPTWKVVEIEDDWTPHGDWIYDEISHVYGVSTIYATDPKSAAIAAARDYFDYDQSSSRYIVISPNDTRTNDDQHEYWPAGNYHIFDVQLEFEPTYTATEIN